MAERLHLFHHALVLLGGVSHVAELLLHLLFIDGFSVHDCLGILLGGQSVDNLFDDGGCVRLSTETEGIGGDGQLTPFNFLLISFCASLKLVLKPGQVLSTSGLLFRFRMSLEKMVDLVMRMSPMLMS
jgi:hypothetical protein